VTASVPGAALEALEQRLAEVPALLGAISAAATLRSPALTEGTSDVTGVGASGFPAVLLTSALSARGQSARLRALVDFAHPLGPLTRGSRLVVFSQGLSPNARLALDARGSYAGTRLYTAIRPSEATPAGAWLQSLGPEVELALHPPPAEGHALLRVQGPLAAATLALAEHGALELRGAKLEQSLRDALEAPPLFLEEPLVWLGTRSSPLPRALAWSWQEAVQTPLGPVLDALEFAHGPLQALFERRGPCVVISTGADSDADLLARLARVLDPARHPLVVLEIATPAAALTAQVRLLRAALVAMRLRGVDPERWPAQGRDGPLYELGGALAPALRATEASGARAAPPLTDRPSGG
jgi:creatinine amidohydrolase